jgi:hypothetical protein
LAANAAGRSTTLLSWSLAAPRTEGYADLYLPDDCLPDDPNHDRQTCASARVVDYSTTKDKAAAGGERTRPYRKQTNGKIERLHRTMADVGKVLPITRLTNLPGQYG